MIFFYLFTFFENEIIGFTFSMECFNLTTDDNADFKIFSTNFNANL